jgi:predicted SprT family Zn-dependent metalloprotease
MVDLLTMEYAAAEITWRRKEIARRLIGTSANIKDHTINRIAPADLELLFGLYDELFLAGWFRHCFAGTLGFSLSSRLTKSAGKTLCPKDIAQRKPSEIRIEIRIGVNFFLQYHAVKNPKPVCGIATADSLEALQLVLEHEICHVIEFLHFHASNCSAARFKRLAGRLFGHTESYHKLPTAQQIARQKYGLRIGDAVSFRFEDTVLHGRVYRLNQRATVMVRDRFGHYTDGNGRRYTKYYVPLELLQK